MSRKRPFVYIYDLSSHIFVCLSRVKICIDFPAHPLSKRSFLTILVRILEDWGYHVVLYTDAEDVANMIYGMAEVYTNTNSEGIRTRVRLRSFDEEGASRLHRLLASDPSYGDGLWDFMFPEEMYPEPGTRNHKVLENRLGQLFQFCKKKEGINLPKECKWLKK